MSQRKISLENFGKDVLLLGKALISLVFYSSALLFYCLKIMSTLPDSVPQFKQECEEKV